MWVHKLKFHFLCYVRDDTSNLTKIKIIYYLKDILFREKSKLSGQIFSKSRSNSPFLSHLTFISSFVPMHFTVRYSLDLMWSRVIISCSKFCICSLVGNLQNFIFMQASTRSFLNWDVLKHKTRKILLLLMHLISKLSPIGIFDIICSRFKEDIFKYFLINLKK